MRPPLTAGRRGPARLWGLVGPWMLLAGLVVACAQPVAAEGLPAGGPGVLRIGSFNAQILGPTKVSRVGTLGVLAAAATQFDLLAIQEVGSNNSSASEATCESVMTSFVNRMNQIAGAGSYTYARGNQYAFVYKSALLELVAYELYPGPQRFTYQPLVGYFKTRGGKLDFSILSIHTSPSLARTEIPQLASAVAVVRDLYKEPDVVVLGDFNADGSYYDEGPGDQLAGWSPQLFITAVPNQADTTVAPSSNTYDRIQMTRSMGEDFELSWGVLHFAQLFDLSLCEGSPQTAGTENALSDHYPVWAQVFVDRDSD